MTGIAETDVSGDARRRSTAGVVCAHDCSMDLTTAGCAPLNCHSDDGYWNQSSSIIELVGRETGTTLFQPSVVPIAEIEPMNGRGGKQRSRDYRGEMPRTDERRHDPFDVLGNEHLMRRRPVARLRPVIRPSDRMCNYINAVRKEGSNGN